MRIAIPDCINNFESIKSLNIDDLIIVEYKQYENNKKNEVLINKNLIGLILKGKKHIRLSDGDCWIEAGDIYFIRKGNYIVSEVFSAKENNYEALLIFFSDEIIYEFIEENNNIFDNTYFSEVRTDYLILKLQPLLKSTVESIFSYITHKHQYIKKIIKLKLYEFLLNLLYTDDGATVKSFLKQIGSIEKNNLSYIMEVNFTKPYRLEEFAKLAYRSISKFKKDFKDIYKIPPKEWINKKRLERANQLIRSNDLAITEISFLVGYENYSHFIQLFKKKFNITPNQLRKINKS